jgi:hypothetical protein
MPLPERNGMADMIIFYRLFGIAGVAGDGLRLYGAIDHSIDYNAVLLAHSELGMIERHIIAIAAGYHFAFAVFYIVVDQRGGQLRLAACGRVAEFAGEDEMVRIDLGTLYRAHIKACVAAGCSGRHHM